MKEQAFTELLAYLKENAAARLELALLLTGCLVFESEQVSCSNDPEDDAVEQKISVRARNLWEQEEE